MPLNRAFIGRSTTSQQPFEVTRGDIRRFAVAIGDTNPAYLDVEAARALGHPDVVAPPTFLITASTGEAGDGFVHDPDLGLNYAMVVHGEERFAFHRPVFAGDALDRVTTISDIQDKGRNETLTLVTEVTCKGEPVATVTNIIVSRGTAATKEA